MQLQRNTTLAELSDCYLENIVKDNNTDSTYKSYKSRMDKYVLPALGTKVVRKLKKIEIQNLIFDLNHRDKSLSASTIRLVKSILHKILDFAVDIELVNKNVADRVRLPSYVRYIPRVYSEVEVTKLLEVSQGSFLYIPINIALKAGLRRSEILALQWRDIVLQDSVIVIRKTVAGNSYNYPKTSRSLRYLKISNDLTGILKQHEYVQKKIMLQNGCIQTDKSLLVCKADGGSYNPTYISRKFSELLKKHELPAGRFHDLRHTYSTYAHNNGMPIKRLSKSLGHNSVVTTLDNYVHIEDKYCIT